MRVVESEFRTPPPFPKKNEAGCSQEFRSKKVRANTKITPPKNFSIIFRKVKRKHTLSIPSRNVLVRKHPSLPRVF